MEYTEIILKSAEQMREMINRVNQKINEIQLKEVPCHLNELTQNVIDNYLKLPSMANIKITQEFMIDIYLMCDVIHIKEILGNLIDNAVEAMCYEGELFFRIYKNKGFHVLEIKDSGCGIDEYSMQDVLKPFWSTKSNIKNIGLGLFCCNKIMQYYGSMSIYSEIDNGTSIFLNFAKKKIISST